MIKAQPNLSIRRQCKLLDIGRSGHYYEPVGRDPEELTLMKRIDEIHLEHPFLGSRKVSHALRAEGKQVNRKATQRLMRLMGLESVAPKPNSMDGRGRYIDIVFVERLWRSLKYEEDFLLAYDDMREATAGIDGYLDCFNCGRQHQAPGLSNCTRPRLSDSPCTPSMATCQLLVNGATDASCQVTTTKNTPIYRYCQT